VIALPEWPIARLLSTLDTLSPQNSAEIVVAITALLRGSGSKSGRPGEVRALRLDPWSPDIVRKACLATTCRSRSST